MTPDPLPPADLDGLVAALRPLIADAVAEAIQAHSDSLLARHDELFMLKRVLTAEEAGRVLGGVGAETVMRYVRELGLPYVRPGKAPLFVLDQVVAWAEQFPEPSDRWG